MCFITFKAWPCLPYFFVSAHWDILDAVSQDGPTTHRRVTWLVSGGAANTLYMVVKRQKDSVAFHGTFCDLQGMWLRMNTAHLYL